MKHGQYLLILGDLHGDLSFLNSYINRHLRQNRRLRTLAAGYETFEVLLFVCGDFGYWPHRDPKHTWLPVGELAPHAGDTKPYGIKTAVPFLKDGHVTIYWCDGNHDNHDALDELERLHPDRSFIPVMPNVYFARFGAVLTLLDGTRVMFCGGASSDAPEERIPGLEWWPQEAVDVTDMERLPDPASQPVDWIVSHTSPLAFTLADARVWPPKNQDNSRPHLDVVRARFHPTRWWFGHYHLHATGTTDGCDWTCLDYPRHQGCWNETRLIEANEDSGYVAPVPKKDHR